MSLKAADKYCHLVAILKNGFISFFFKLKVNYCSHFSLCSTVKIKAWSHLHFCFAAAEGVWFQGLELEVELVLAGRLYSDLNEKKKKHEITANLRQS